MTKHKHDGYLDEIQERMDGDVFRAMFEVMAQRVMEEELARHLGADRHERTQKRHAAVVVARSGQVQRSMRDGRVAAAANHVIAIRTGTTSGALDVARAVQAGWNTTEQIRRGGCCFGVGDHWRVHVAWGGVESGCYDRVEPAALLDQRRRRRNREERSRPAGGAAKAARRSAAWRKAVRRKTLQRNRGRRRTVPQRRQAS